MRKRKRGLKFDSTFGSKSPEFWSSNKKTDISRKPAYPERTSGGVDSRIDAVSYFMAILYYILLHHELEHQQIHIEFRNTQVECIGQNGLLLLIHSFIHSLQEYLWKSSPFSAPRKLQAALMHCNVM